MSDAPTREELEHLESIAALGCLLNAIAHDLNNQLTNLMLGADQAQYTGSKDAIDLMVQQAQNIASITRSIQQLGHHNLSDGVGAVDLAEAAQEFSRWHAASAAGPIEVSAATPGPRVSSKLRNLVLALSMISRGATHGTLSVAVAAEDVPRSSWSGSSETVTMALVRLRRGDPPPDKSPSFGQLIDGFFEAPRTPAEIGVMAAWEILRKVRGRPSPRLELYGELSGDHEVVIALPLAAD